jgi:urease accessory protein
MSAPSLVRALHLASTTLPVGAFSYSQGLEAAVEHGVVRSAADAHAWIAQALALSLARFEAPFVVAAMRAWSAGDDVRTAGLDLRYRATRESAELLAETLQMGYSLRRWCSETAALPPAWNARLAALASPAYPSVFAAVAAAWALDEHAALTAYLWGWLENQVNAAMKVVPLGQSDGQRILLALGAGLDDAVDAAIARAGGEESWATQCPMLAVLSSRHESQYSRLFRS